MSNGIAASNLKFQKCVQNFTYRIYSHLHMYTYACMYNYILITVFYQISQKYVKRKILCSKANPHIVIWVKNLSVALETTFPNAQARNNG